MMKSYYHRLDNFLPLTEVKDTMIVLSTLPTEKVIVPELPPAENIDKKLSSLAYLPTYNINEIDTVYEKPNLTKEIGSNTHVVINDTTALHEINPTNFINLEDHSEPLVFVTEYPEYPGGEAERLDFLKNNIVYPEIAKQTGIQGTVYVSFVVNKNGSISDISIERGIGGGCDEESVRVLKMMPSWVPGKQSGKEVRVKCTMSVKFILMN